MRSAVSSAPDGRPSVKGLPVSKGNSGLTKDQKNEIRALAELPDDRIDTTEVPEVLDWSRAKRGLFYRPVDQQTTSRPDFESVCGQARPSDDLPVREGGVEEGRSRNPTRNPTDQEIEGYEKVRTMVAEMVDPNKIALRTQQGYCSVLFDDNGRKRICQLYFEAAPAMKLGLFDEQKKVTKHSLDSVDDIWKYADQLRAAVKRYLHP